MATITIGTTIEPNRRVSRSIRAWLGHRVTFAATQTRTVLAVGRRTGASDHALESGVDHMVRHNVYPGI